MILWIFLVLGLLMIQTFIPVTLRFLATKDIGGSLSTALGARDDLPPLPLAGQRAERALKNLFESLPAFLTLAVLNVALGPVAEGAITGAMIFFIARALYVFAYIFGIPALRSLIWMVGWVGIIMMALPLL